MTRRMVVRVQIEWQTERRYRMMAAKPWTFGRVWLWLTLECGHHEQRARPRDKRGKFAPPRHVNCSECAGE